MKRISTLLIFFILSVSYAHHIYSNNLVNQKRTVYNPDKLITLGGKYLVKDLIKKISHITGVVFFYNSELEELKTEVYINVKNATVIEVLNILCKQVSVEYEVDENHILLRRSKNVNQTPKSDTLVGVVVDEKGNPVPGVNVVIDNTYKGTISAFDGGFVINLNIGDKLVFSAIGYEKKTFLYNGEPELKITIAESSKMLADIIVVGYGKQGINDVTGALSHIRAKSIRKQTVFHAAEIIAGNAAGVYTIVPSGKPQVDSYIRIRGVTSITASSDPLYVIDGIRLESMIDLNPIDIESITILKDASASAIFGAAGANGVIIIETKRGADKKGVVSFGYNYGFSKISKKISTLDAGGYISLMEELGLTTDWSLYTANTDWHNEIYRIGSYQNYQLSLSGSDNKNNYYVSGNFQKKEGVVRNNELDRIATRFNMDRQVKSWLKIGARLLYSKWSDINIEDNDGGNDGGVILSTLVTPPIIPIYNDDGTYTGNPLQKSWENPVALVYGAKHNTDNRRLLGNVFLKFNLGNKLSNKTEFSINDYTRIVRFYMDPYLTEWGRVNKGIAKEERNVNSSWMIENLVSYKKAFGFNDIEIMAGVIISKRKTSYLFLDTRNFTNSSNESISGGASVYELTENQFVRTNLSVLGRVNYSYNDKYLLTCNLRSDASSVFGPEKRWGLFPSLSVGWRLSKESFMQNQFVFSNLKLRYGWGKTGNDRIDVYSWQGLVGSRYNYVLDDKITSGIMRESINNKELQWESTMQNNLGVDFGLLKDRINVTLDVYSKKTSKLLLSFPIPTTTGFSTEIKNKGKISNKGGEVKVDYKVIDKDFNWETGLNASFNRCSVVDLGGQVMEAGYIYQRGNLITIKEGEELGNFIGYVAKGVNPQTGDMVYDDLNGDGIITSTDDKTIIGNPNPDFSYGITNSITYKGIGLCVFLQGVKGNEVFNATRINTEGMLDFRNQTDVVLRRWQNEGDITDVPRSNSADTYNSEISTRFIEDGSFLRVKTVTASYTFPKKKINEKKIEDVVVYLTAGNLFTFTKYSGYDPEVNAFGNSNVEQGIDYGTYPKAKSIVFGLNISF